MHLLFCCATGGELRVVKEEIKKLNLKMHLPVQYFCTGMGNHASIFSLTKKLLEHPETPYLIVNIGVCGYRGTYAPLVQLATLSHLELAKEVIIPILFPFAPLRSCLSAESVVFAPAVSWKQDFVIDMESYGIEYVCQQFQLPRMYLKVPVDGSAEETQSFDRLAALEQLRRYLPWESLLLKLMDYILLYNKNKKSQYFFASL